MRDVWDTVKGMKFSAHDKRQAETKQLGLQSTAHLKSRNVSSKKIAVKTLILAYVKMGSTADICTEWSEL